MNSYSPTVMKTFIPIMKCQYTLNPNIVSEIYVAVKFFKRRQFIICGALNYYLLLDNSLNSTFVHFSFARNLWSLVD